MRRRPFPIELIGLLVPLFLLGGWGCAGASSGPNLLLVTFDTTRADHLACYGHPRARTAHVDGLAAEGVLFEHAFSSIPLTLPSHSTILTGTYPPAHGVRDNGLFVVDESRLTLAEILRDNGYRTAAAVGGFPLVERFGIGQGFELFDDKLRDRDHDFLGRRNRGPSLYFEERSAGLVNEAAFGWLEEHAAEPFFLWLHYYDPHEPLLPPPPYDQLFADEPYLGEIAYADESFGQVLEKLDALGVYDQTMIIMTADHGEGRGEHGELTHSHLLYNSTLHVPLIVKSPGGREGVRIGDQVGSVDILPTVLDVLGIEAPATLQGRSLRRYLERENPASPRPRPLYAETLSPRLSHNWGELRALYDGDYKYIHGPRPELYNVVLDVDEKSDLLAEEPLKARQMRQDLETLLGMIASSEPVDATLADDATREKLEALGYLSGSAGETTIVEELRSDGVPPQDRAGDTSAASQARSLVHRGQPMGALAFVNPLIEANPENRFYRELRVQALLMLGRTDEAMAEVRTLESLGPETAGSLSGLMQILGMTLYRSGRRGEGLEIFQSALERKADAEGFFLWAGLLQEEGRFEEARSALEKALDLQTDWAPALSDLAVFEAREGNASAAEELFRRALESEPYRAKTHYNYGAFLLKDGRLHAAQASFERALRLEANYPEAYYGLVVTHLMLEDLEPAMATFERMQRALPDAPETERARALLEESA